MLKEGQEQKSKNKKDANAIGGKWEEVEKIHVASLQDFMQSDRVTRICMDLILKTSKI